jgi:hypothetical protein
MFLRIRQLPIMLVLLSLGILPLLSETPPDHIVAVPDLHQAVRSAAQARQDNLTKLDKFFASERARKALETVKLDPVKVSRALTLLSDEELANLVARSDKMQSDVAAGSLSNQQITYILIALATAVIILVIVAAK